MALRFSCLDRALPQGKEPPAHRKALSGAGRLFCLEAEALRIFFQRVGNSIAISSCPAADHNRHCWKFLRPLYRERRLYARLRTSGPLRLRYFKHRQREQGGFAADETISQSRYSPFPAHFVWETRPAPIMPVERGFQSATAPPHITMVASENVANLSARSYRERRIRKKQNEFA